MSSVMTTLVESGAAGQALAVFDVLPTVGIVADTATLNAAVVALDLRTPLPLINTIKIDSKLKSGGEGRLAALQVRGGLCYAVTLRPAIRTRTVPVSKQDMICEIPVVHVV